MLNAQSAIPESWSAPACDLCKQKAAVVLRKHGKGLFRCPGHFDAKMSAIAGYNVMHLPELAPAAAPSAMLAMIRANMIQLRDHLIRENARLDRELAQPIRP